MVLYGRAPERGSDRDRSQQRRLVHEQRGRDLAQRGMLDLGDAIVVGHVYRY